MGAFATGFLLMGIALVYGATGSFDIGEINTHVSQNKTALPGFFRVGLLLILIGMAFKISAVPFHFWAPDVYTGSPTIITAFMSTVVKVAAIGAFYKLFAQCFLPVQDSVVDIIQIIIVLTLIVANVTAVYQTSVKRMLAYSSVAQVGYILLGFISGGLTPEGVVFYYLIAYSSASLTAFGIISILENRFGNVSLETLRGLFYKAPFAAACLTIVLLSLAGIPPLAGFFAKYIILGRAIDADHIFLTILAVVTSLIGIYYYFRPIIAMTGPGSQSTDQIFSPLQKIVVGILTLVPLLAGMFPEALISLLN
jgi:NADH-quinone oxidoreductase subunit N